jgi:hypothetical protein
MSSGFGGLNKSEKGVVISLVQLQLPVVKTPGDLEGQTKRIVEMVSVWVGWLPVWQRSLAQRMVATW